MNEKFLENLIVYQENIEPLNEELFKDFMLKMMSLYDFLSKENDLFLNKKETREKINQNEDFLESFRNMRAIEKLEINRDTKFKLLKYLLEKNSPGDDNRVSMFSIYFFWRNSEKLLKKQQKELLTILKKDKGNNFLGKGFFVLNMFLVLNLVKEKTLVENIKGFRFELIHQINENNLIDYNKMSDTQFIHYLAAQFETYKLRNDLSLIKNEVSLETAVKPYLEQLNNKQKKDILAVFLNMIRDSLKLDNENHQFIDKLVLNTRLNNKEELKEIKITKPKKI